MFCTLIHFPPSKARVNTDLVLSDFKLKSRNRSSRSKYYGHLVGGLFLKTKLVSTKLVTTKLMPKW